MASITSRSTTPPSVSTSSAVLSTSTILTSVNSTKDSDPKTDDSQTIRFTKVQDLFNRIDRTSGDSLTVTNVSPSHFTEIQREREERENQGRRYRFRDYDSNSRILIITITTDLHEQLHKLPYDEFLGQIRDMGLKDSWKNISNTTLPGQQGQSGKEGDSASGPRSQRTGKGAWPTLVIEAGQSITITQNATTNPISYNVTRGALILSFRLLFLRDPGPAEGDLVFGVQELQQYAERIWAEV
ncbi:hypothetical protein B0T24DRAFT_694330 [Lasiosphaeria ovina]|uniref:Uncharacterized protein n=1 Tax=Lasiosphaeria ovina TaxID=92902 RepID=A0AAE0KLR8_9PEZI|nr:hypothetical protein B0T24DRAFT_694330 [Lasiosphaeria ovina]